MTWNRFAAGLLLSSGDPLGPVGSRCVCDVGNHSAYHRPRLAFSWLQSLAPLTGCALPPICCRQLAARAVRAHARDLILGSPHVARFAVSGWWGRRGAAPLSRLSCHRRGGRAGRRRAHGLGSRALPLAHALAAAAGLAWRPHFLPSRLHRVGTPAGRGGAASGSP